jgi:hypothetical protein
MKLHRISIAAASLLLFAASLTAQIPHTWVSSTGSDTTGNGTPALPYASFHAAVNNTAAGGIVSILGPGDYGPVGITQSITIDGTGGGTITFAGTEGIYIDPTASSGTTVILRNLAINGLGLGTIGIYVTGTANLSIDNCLLEGFTTEGVYLLSTGAENLDIRNTVIVGGSYGVRTFAGTGPDHVSLEHVKIQGASSYGVYHSSGNLEISDSVITHSGTAIYAISNASVNTERTIFSLNATALCINPGSKIQLLNTDLFDNTTEITNCGGTVVGAGGAAPSPRL